MMKQLFCFLLVVPLLVVSQPLDWKTYCERSNFLRTPRYAETMNFCRQLEMASPWVRSTSFGTSPQGRRLPLVIVSKDRAFTPADARRTGKPVLLVQSCIHAGETDGKDASLILIRDMVITKERAALLDEVIILFIPIFNVDGHERFGPFNRVNQNGPAEVGWRVTAQNLNLNRDYMKADAPEMRAWLAMYNAWLPDFFVDCHVTDGIDFQYDVTFAMEPYPNADAELASWYEREYIPTLIQNVEQAGHGIAPYVMPREEADLSKGLAKSVSGPRLSTGYCAKQNRPALLIETHSLKPYRTRVMSTYEILLSTIAFLNRTGGELRSRLAAIDKRVAGMGTSELPAWLPLRWEWTGASHSMPFRGVVTKRERSEISGTDRLLYTTTPENSTVPYLDVFRVTDSVTVPLAYVVPGEWSHLVDLMKLHGIAARTLKKEMTLEVESYRLTEPRWQERPYEGRHGVRFKAERITERRSVPAGSYFIPTNQRTASVLVNLLEPTAPDAFAAWGFFDAIFEQKEYGEPYVLETLARELMQKDTALAQDFYRKLASDTTFAKNPYARLNFFYQRSPYWDRSIGAYPVLRVVGEAKGRTQTAK